MTELERINCIERNLSHLVYLARRNKLISFLLISIPIVISVSIVMLIFSVATLWNFLLTSLLMIVLLLVFFNSKTYQQINFETISEHINRAFAEFEESAQLLLSDPSQLSIIQKLQVIQVRNLFNIYFNDGRLARCLPKVNIKKPLYFSLPIFILILSINPLTHIVDHLFSRTIEIPLKDGLQTADKTLEKSVKLIQSKIKIVSPSYTNIDPIEVNEMNLSIVEGATINWQFEFSRNDVNYYLVGLSENSSDEKNQKIEMSEEGGHSITRQISQTSIYSIVYEENGKIIALPGVYSIIVVADQSPKIKIIKPNQSLVEIAKAGDVHFSLEALIKDDYAIAEVKILASVAKGSGEAVKFRDKQFEFERFAETGNFRSYKKSWSLIDLDMEPGDEVYFRVTAKDNKQPEAQLTKSSTVIVRWLDEQAIEMASEGLSINFVPEYFRSQRQIIIETEQLIADQKDLTVTQFSEISVDLGHSQKDLKDKYGEYLGDEIGEGPGEQYGLADGYHGGETSFAGEASSGMDEKHQDDNHQNERQHEHQNLHENQNIHQNDLSGKTELIAQFAHNHGTVEIGPISKRDPKSWMKQAVNEMWQAELHLMLAEPAKALPFEYAAYKYLKLARQADRIYAKRLGFEPPPVSEERRLTGELKDIFNQSLSIQDNIDPKADNVLLQEIYRLISKSAPKQKLTKTQKELIRRLIEKFLVLANTKPVLIKYATTLERVLIAESFNLSGCDNCILELQQKLWQLLPEPLSLPKVKIRASQDNKPELKDYLQKIKHIKMTGTNNG